MDRKLKSELQAELQPLKDDITSMKDDMYSMKGEISSMKDDMYSMKNEISSINGQIDFLKNEQIKTSLMIENEILPGMKLLKENYIPASKRYMQESARIESMQADIEVMKSVIREHSEKLQKIS